MLVDFGVHGNFFKIAGFVYFTAECEIVKTYSSCVICCELFVLSKFFVKVSQV